MLDGRFSALWNYDRDHVKPSGAMVGRFLEQVVPSHPNYLLAFAAIDVDLGVGRRIAPPGFDLGEDQGVVVFGDDVNLASRAAVVSSNDPVAQSLEETSRQALPLRAETHTPTTSGFWASSDSLAPAEALDATEPLALAFLALDTRSSFSLRPLPTRSRR